ncbi:MAG: tetratricopeptide repeat protein [Bacteroidota bacterium]
MLTLYIYLPALDNKFTNWDDPTYVLENKNVKLPISQNFTYFFSHASADNYHPLTMLSLSLDYHLARKVPSQVNAADEPDAAQFHATNLVLHLVNVLLVFFFIYRLTRQRLIVASVTALLFAIHPMHVESVAWIAERKDVLYSFFFLAGLILYLKYLEKQQWMFLLPTGLLFTLSLFSKPAAVVFPLVLLVIDYFSARKFTYRLLIEKIPFFILSGLFGLVTLGIQGSLAEAGLKVFPAAHRIMFTSYGLIMYPFKLLLPSSISAFYPYPSLDPAGHLPAYFYFSPVIVCAIAALVWYSSRFTRVVSFGFLFYLASMVLVIQFVPVGNAIRADRYSYLSAIGLFFIIAWYLDQAYISKGKIMQSARWAITAVCLVYFIFLGKMTREQTVVWQNSETLWNDVIAKYPETYVGYKHRGNYYSSQNNFEMAIKDYESYVRIRQDDAGIYNNLGNAYRLHGENEKAIGAYTKSIAVDSLDPKTWLNRAVIYSIEKHYDAAMKDFNKALTLKPGTMELYISRSVMYKEMRRYQEAIDDYSHVVRENPRNVNAFMDRGYCHMMLKQFPEAKADFEQCIALTPESGQAYYNLSATFNELKDYRKAYQYILKAQSLGYPVDATLLETMKKKGS